MIAMGQKCSRSTLGNDDFALAVVWRDLAYGRDVRGNGSRTHVTSVLAIWSLGVQQLVRRRRGSVASSCALPLLLSVEVLTMMRQGVVAQRFSGVSTHTPPTLGTLHRAASKTLQ